MAGGGGVTAEASPRTAVDLLAETVQAVRVVLDNAAADADTGRLHPDAAVVVARVRCVLPDPEATRG